MILYRTRAVLPLERPMVRRVSLEGRRKIAQGREAEVFEWDDGAVLKLFRSAEGRDEAEAAALASVASAGGPGPRIVGRTILEGRPGLIIQRTEGVEMLSLLAKRPWVVVSAARMLADAHLFIHAIPAPVGLQDMRRLLEDRIREAAMPDVLRSFALAKLESLPEGDRLCHGDFHPGNVFVTGRRASVIDWTGAGRGDPLLDVARTKLLLTLGEPLDPSAWMRAVVRVGRGLFATVYGKRYASRSTLDETLLKEALVVNAAARLTEGIAEERETLIALIARARG